MNMSKIIRWAALALLFSFNQASAATNNDLSVTKTGVASVNMGSTFQYVISVKNVGPANQPPGTIQVADTLPAGLIFVSVTGSNWICSFTSPTVNCTYNKPINKGKTTSTITITVTAPAMATTVTNTATVSGISNTDPKASNNSSSLTTTIINPSPGYFNVYEPNTAAGAVLGNILTKISGLGYTLDVAALNAARTAVDTTFTGTVKIEVLDAKDSTGTLSATTGCNTSWTTVLSSFTATVTAGRTTVTFPAVADVYRDVRVKVSYPTITPTKIGCSTDNFVIRPDRFASISVSDADWVTTGTVRTLNNLATSGGVVHKAGQFFRIIATAVNRSGVATSNYTNSTFYAGMPSTDVAAVLQPVGGVSGVAAPGVMAVSGSAGQVLSTDASYDEAGIITLRVFDDGFDAVDAGDTTLLGGSSVYDLGRRIQGTFDTGRFVPDHFDLATNNTPQFRTFNNTCAAARSFTYFGQPFAYVTAPQVLVTAYNGLATPTVTDNYRNSLWKITTAVPVKTCTTGPDTCTLLSTSATSQITQTYTYTTTPAATPNWDSSQVAVLAPVVVGSNGTGTVTSNAADVLAFLRSVSTPQQLITADITLTESVKDTSEAGNCGVAGAGACDITTTTSAVFNPIAFDAGNEFRYGRLKLSNAYGSELLNLTVPLMAEYWNGAAFITNTADNCTTLLANNFKLTTPPAGVSVTVGGAFSLGVGSLTLTKPTTPAKATVDLCVDLGVDPVGGTVCAATLANLPYLQGLWSPGSSYNNDPAARATFGIYKGKNDFIYQREAY